MYVYMFVFILNCVYMLALTESSSLDMCRGGGSSSDSSSDDSGFRFFFFPILMTIFLREGKKKQHEYNVMKAWLVTNLQCSKVSCTVV